ncbi:MAG: toll/interleukin-1 receptor domain-containing protein, partial [Bacteroidota bacterium]|nr:toll/interleukin-1 receptor domain-containing protein [Bacteroidota bacterium]
MTTVFISYSHKDEAWKDRLVTHLGVLQQEGILDEWDDRRIGAGEDWYQKIEEAIARANVAVLLVSADFLTSKFILSKEIPDLLERRDKEGLRIFPVIIKPCAYKQVEWLARMNLRPKDGRPIQGGSEFQIETDLTAIADEIAGIIGPIEMPESEGYIPLGPEKISLAKLPATNPELFGRDKELKLLDKIWDNTGTNIICLVAWGGVGKTALVNTWLSKMRQDNFRGAERVFGWSFYSQGAAESKQASADQFIASALKWFGDPEPDAGSPWEKGERLAEFVRKQKTLLILDGLEPLQHPFREQEGRIRDPGLQSLVRELANYNPGLCVITTRLDVDDIKDFVGTTVENIHLEHLSEEAGLELFKHL